LIRGIPHGIFSLFFPDDCRICKRALTGITRVPVCEGCLRAPETPEADYFCNVCNASFLNDSPLDERGVCTVCRSGLRGFDHAVSVGMYEGPLRSLIQLFKYSGMRPLAGQLGGFLSAAVLAEDHFDAIVPVPLYWRKRWERGFNQSAALAERVGRMRGIPVWNALRRTRATSTQAGLASAGRRKNVAGAFAVRPAAKLNGTRILLIDDVMTTGATASACAATLKRGGAMSVSLLTLARVDRRFRP
jgi:ComF family protein